MTLHADLKSVLEYVAESDCVEESEENLRTFSIHPDSHDCTCVVCKARRILANAYDHHYTYQRDPAATILS